MVANALMHTIAPPAPDERDALRERGPVRIVARAEPHKGIAELLKAYPAGLDRPAQIVPAEAGSEYWPGMRNDVVTECRAPAAGLPGVEILPAMPWQEVPSFLAAAAVTVVSSASPETFGNAAAEARSVGTPVADYGLGHLPSLTGLAGRMTALESGPGVLSEAATSLLNNPAAHHAASAAGHPMPTNLRMPPVDQQPTGWTAVRMAMDGRADDRQPHPVRRLRGH